MKPRQASNKGDLAQAVLAALRRAAKKAVEIGRLTGTPAYVLEEGRIIDIAKRARKTRETRRGS